MLEPPLVERSTSILGLALVLAGCNQIYGLDPTTIAPQEAGIIETDVDLDGIDDAMDKCLASPRDDMDDLDEDSVLAKDDPCPFDKGSAGDSDNDGLHNICDPFPTTSGDRLRCYMSFTSTGLNDMLWKPRDTTNDWTSREGELFSKAVGPTSGIVATRDFDAGAQTTIDAFIGLANGNANQIYAFRVWARAADQFDNAELGCEVSGDDNSTRFAVVRGNDMDVPPSAMTSFLAFPRHGESLRIRMTLAVAATNGPNVRCELIGFAQSPLVVKARVDPLPAGRIAFGTENAHAHVSALAI